MRTHQQLVHWWQPSMTAALHRECSRAFSLAGGAALVSACLLISWGAAACCRLRCQAPPHLSGLQFARTAAHQQAAAADMMPQVPHGYRQVEPAGGGAPVMLPFSGRVCLVPHSMPQPDNVYVVRRDTCNLMVI